jgi:hypothetical protein
MTNKKYTSGAAFERKIVHALVDMGFDIVVRGAGSKSYGSIKADIIAYDTATQYLLIIQAKHSKNKFAAERAKFLGYDASKGDIDIIPGTKTVFIWITTENFSSIFNYLRKLNGQS